MPAEQGSDVTGFVVNIDNPAEHKIVSAPRAALAANQVRFGVDSFALTSNNITYSSMGRGGLDYFGFFPTGEEPWGYVPAMGYGTVLESSHPEIPTGGRYWGFYPMASEAIINAEPSGTGDIRDTGAHRTNHAPLYRAFSNTTSDPTYNADREPQALLLRGLFTTSYLLDDFFAGQDALKEADVVILSASSKTAIVLAYLANDRGATVAAVTSPANKAFVESLGCYAKTVTYDDLTSLDADAPTVLVDISGNAQVVAAAHHHFKDLRHSTILGATHRNAPRGQQGQAQLPGPARSFFFAPGQLEEKISKEGSQAVMSDIAQRLDAFYGFSDGWLQVERHTGPGALAKVYTQVRDGQSPAAAGHIISL